MKYEIYETQMKDMYIKKIDDNGLETYIPCDPANSDYQAYLNKDKAEDSTPEVPLA